MRFKPRDFQVETLDFCWAKEKTAVWTTMGGGKTVTAATFVADTLFDSFTASRWLVVAPRLVAERTWTTEFSKWDHLSHIKPRRLVASDFELEPGIVVERDGQLIEVRHSQRLDSDIVSLKRIYDAIDGGRFEQLLDTPNFALDREHVLYDPRAILQRRTGLQMPSRGTVKKRLLSYAEPVQVVSFEFLPWLVRALGRNWPYDGVIIDESTFVQNPQAVRFKALDHVINKLGVVRYVLELSGLPAPNGHEGLWSQFKLLDKGELLGRTLTEFRNTWLVPDTVNRATGQIYDWTIRQRDEPAFNARLAGRAISASFDIGIPLVEADLPVTLPPEARAFYDGLEDQLAARMTEGGEVFTAASGGVLHGKLMQICNGAIYDAQHVAKRVHDAKIDVLLELTESLTRGVILAYKFQYDLPLLKKVLGKHVAGSKERGAIDAFAAGKLKFLATQPGSLSHGLDGLQAIGHNVVWFGVPENYEHYAQLIKRLHRFGQEASTVYVHRLFAESTVEEDLVRLVLPRKMGVDDAVRAGVLARCLRRR